jgi:hypothetical protein
MLFLKPVSLACLFAAVAAFGATSAIAADPKSLNNEDWYQVRTEDKFYLFDDYKVYRDFLVSGTAPVIRDLGEKDKMGLSVILALGADQQDTPLEEISAYQFYRVALPSAWPFYGELRQDGVIYVFRRAGDMTETNNLGEPIFSYTDIGGGPNGERVVYVLVKEEKLPEDTVKKFKTNYGIK